MKPTSHSVCSKQSYVEHSCNQTLLSGIVIKLKQQLKSFQSKIPGSFENK